MDTRIRNSTFRNAALCAFIVITGALSVTAHAGKPGRASVSIERQDSGPSPVARKAATAGSVVVEYYHQGLDNYFITSEPAEQAAVDAGAAGAFLRTGDSFGVGGPSQVCRFYGNSNINPATGAIHGPNSHFYTADAPECASLKAQFDPNAKSWKFESNDFLTTPAVNGACPTGLVPVYRAYNNGFARGVDSNHRITANQVAYQQTVARGWIGEGIVMCAPGAPPSTILPSVLAACGETDCPASSVSLGSGIGVVNVVVEIANPSPNAPLELIVPAGQTFISAIGTIQDGIAIERLQSTIAPGTTGRFVLVLFCINQDRGASSTAASYSPGPITSNAKLLDLVSLAAGKLGSALDPGNLKAGAMQLAIWEITNHSGSLTTEGRNLLVALLATDAADLNTQGMLYQQFQATLTPT